MKTIEDLERQMQRAEEERIKRLEDEMRPSIIKQMEEKGQRTTVKDENGIRWVKCQLCSLVAPEDKFCSYGGEGKINLGICRECYKKPETLEMIRKGLI